MVAPVGTLVRVKEPSDVDRVAPFPLTETVTPARGALFSSRTVPDILVRFCAEAISQQNIQHSTVYIVQNFLFEWFHFLQLIPLLDRHPAHLHAVSILQTAHNPYDNGES